MADIFRSPVMTIIRTGRPLPMALLLIPFLYLVFSNPFDEPAQTILEVIYLCIILGITVWETTRNTDEVEAAGASLRRSASTMAGFLIGALW
jgi:Na+/H+-dicarboxylate symporter